MEEQEAGGRLEDRERQARQLPQSYENLMFIDKTFAMGGTMFAPHGTLKVNPEGLQFVSKKRTHVLTGAQLRNVAIVMEPTQRQHDFERCVAVEYDLDGRTKRFLLLPALTAQLRAAKENLLEMVQASLLALKVMK